MQRAKSVLYEGLIAWNFYEDLSKNHSKLEVINNKVTQTIDQLRESRAFESSIFAWVAPMVHQLEQIVESAANKSNEQLHVPLDLSKWRIKSFIGKVELILHEMSKRMPYELGDDYQKSSDIVDSLISFWFTIYGHVHDPKLKKIIPELKSLIHSDFYI